MLGFLKSNSAPIAIDFGYAAVKVLQIQPGEPPELIGAAMLEIPASIRSSPIDRQEFLQGELPKLIQSGGFRGKVACCSIPAWQTFVQHLQLDKAESADMAEQVMAQLQMAIAIDPSQAVIRHVEAGDVFREGKSVREVIAFAVSRDVVMNQVELLKRCKLEVGGLHAEPLAVLHAYQHLYRRAGDDIVTTLYLDIGYHGTQAVIAQGRELKFAKSIPVGGRHLDMEIARALHCELEEAFDRRMQDVRGSVGQSAAASMGRGENGATMSGHNGTPDQVRSGSPQSGGSVSVNEETQPAGQTMVVDGYERRAGSIPQEFQRLSESEPESTGSSEGGAGQTGDGSDVRNAMSDVVLQLVDELRMCVRYHRAMIPDRPIDRMIMNGGESRDTALCRHIASILGVKAFVGGPMKRVALPTDSVVQLLGIEGLECQPAWAVPMGLCLSPVDG